MAFRVHVNMKRCTGCGNCVNACPVNALEIHTSDRAMRERTHAVRNGQSVCVDLHSGLCSGCGVCILACPRDAISLTGQWMTPGHLIPTPRHAERHVHAPSMLPIPGEVFP